MSLIQGKDVELKDRNTQNGALLKLDTSERGLYPTEPVVSKQPDCQLVPKDEGNAEVTPDEILHELGGCGRFQILLVITIHAMKTVVCWSLVGNAFFAFTPRWRCADDDVITSINITEHESNGVGYNESLIGNSSDEKWNKRCQTTSGKVCTRFEFEEGTRTLVTEFDLVCDMSWVPATIMSVQMAGMCVGSLMCGQMADLLGRKITIFTSMVVLFIFHIVSYFPVAWIQIAVARFFMGAGCAFYLALCDTITTEFTASRWRAVVTGIPSWAMEGSLFALVAYLLQDWKKLTLVMAILSLVTLSAWLFVPESLRWYMTHNKYDRAEILMNKIAKWNNKKDIDPDIMSKIETQSNNTPNVKKYSVLILFRKKPLLKMTAPLTVIWCAMGLITYGINFAVQKLSGSLYLNMFLFSIASMPAKLVAMYLQNRFGRKFTNFAAFTICLIGGLVVGVIQYIDTPYRDSLTNYCALAAMAGVDASWGSVQTHTVELYPTVVRSTGFGFVSIFARFGAVIGPQFVYLSEFVPGLLFFVVAAIALFSMLSLATLPETRNKAMIDRLGDINSRKTELNESEMI